MDGPRLRTLLLATALGGALGACQVEPAPEQLTSDALRTNCLAALDAPKARPAKAELAALLDAEIVAVEECRDHADLLESIRIIEGPGAEDAPAKVGLVFEEGER